MKVASNISSAQKDILPDITSFSSESPISLLGLSRRSFNALIKSGFDIVDKFLTLDEESLLEIDNLGKKSIKEIITIQEQLRQQGITTEDDYIDIINVPDCRFIKTKETIYPTDYIGVLDISFRAHNVLYNAGVFSVGKLFNMEKEAVYNLKNVSNKIYEELFTFIANEKPLVGKISGNEDIIYYIQEITQEQQDYRMSTLEESFKKIPQNRLDIPLSFFLQNYNSENIQYLITHLSQILKKITKISEIKKIFSIIVKTSKTNDLIRILVLLSFNLIQSLTETFEPFFSDLQYAKSLEILYQRANGFTLKDIAEKRNVTRERIRQIELKSSKKTA